MYANVRRSAASSVSIIPTATASPTTGSQIRRGMVEELSATDKQMLELCVGEDAKTSNEMEEFFGLIMEANAFDKAALETDSASFLTPSGFGTIREALRENKFFLPLMIVQNKEWQATFPGFRIPQISRSRYPVYNDSKEITPDNAGKPKAICDLDVVEVYLGALVNGLSSIYRDPQLKMFKMLWALTRTIRYTLSNHMQNRRKANHEEFSAVVERLHQLIRNRDSSVMAARQYKEYIATLHPSDYFSALYHLMLLYPEDVHKSALPKMDVILSGLITQQSYYTGTANLEPVQLDGISDQILRMVMERSIKDVPRSNYDEFTELEPLVQAVHERSGHKLEGSLRYWTFIVQVLRNIVLKPNFYSLESFATLIITVRDQVRQLSGILPYCFTVYPDSNRYLSEATIAEFLISAVQADRKFTVMNTALLGSVTQTPQLQNIITRNVARVEIVRKNMDETVGKFQEMNEAAVLGEYLTHVRVNGYAEMAKLVAAQALIGDENSVQVIKAIAANHTLSNAYSVNSVYALAARLSAKDTPLYRFFVDWYGNERALNCVLASGPGRTYRGQLVNDLQKQVNFDDFKSSKNNESEPVQPIEYVRFEVARAIARRNEELMDQKMTSDDIRIECPICFDEKPVSQFRELHPVVSSVEFRHSTCLACSERLEICPFCRRDL